MKRSKPTKSAKRGRPKVGATPVNVRLAPPLLNALDRFIADEPENLSRPNAVRVLLADSLEGLGYFPKEGRK